MYTLARRATLITMYNYVATTRIPQMELVNSSNINPSIFAVYGFALSGNLSLSDVGMSPSTKQGEQNNAQESDPL